MLKNSKNIIIIGMPNSGKTRLGEKISDLFNIFAYDTDDIVRKRFDDMSITEIFEKYGEKRFREVEAEVFFILMIHEGYVISTGGGIVENETNRKLMKDGLVIYIKRPISEIIKDMDLKNRPLLKTGNIEATLTEMYERRNKYYEELADYTVEAEEGEAELIAYLTDFIKKREV